MMENRDRVTLIITITVSLFLLISLVGTLMLALREVDTGEVWDKVFNIVGVLVGAIAGYIAGRTTQNKDR